MSSPPVRGDTSRQLDFPEFPRKNKELRQSADWRTLPAEISADWIYPVDFLDVPVGRRLPTESSRQKMGSSRQSFCQLYRYSFSS